MLEQYSEVTNRVVKPGESRQKKAPPSPGSNSEDGANDTIGRFLQWGSLHFRYPIFVMSRLVPKNVAHLGGTVLFAGHPLLIMIIILIVNIYFRKV